MMLMLVMGMAMQVDKVADMVVNMEADKGTDKLADMVVLMVENMEVDKVSNEVPNEVAHMVVDMEDRPGLPGLAYLRCLFDFFYLLCTCILQKQMCDILSC